MAHEFDSGMFTKTAAWHGLGTVLEAAPKTTADAIVAAGMDWSVIEQPLITCGPQGTPELLEDHKVLKRPDNGFTLNVCRKDWTPVQNCDAFGFFDPILQDGDAQIDAAVSLRDGKRIAITAKVLGSAGEVLPGDEVDQYVVLFNSHDGSLSLGVMFTGVRVVCSNTLALSIGDRKRRGGYAKFGVSDDVAITSKMVRLRHTPNIHSNLEIVRDAINLSRRQFDLTMDEYRTMAKTPMTTALFRAYLTKVFEAELGDRPVTDFRPYEQLEKNFEAGIGADIKGVRGTAWAGYQAVTEFASHQRGVNDDIESERSRLNQLWFGSGAQLIETAHREALAIAR